MLGIALLLGLASVALPDGVGGLVDVQPSPLWIVVLAIAVRYGAAAGYLVGALASGVELFLRWTHSARGIGADGWILALLLLAVGGAVGEIVDARERRVAGLEENLGKAGRSLEGLTDECRAAEAALAELQKQVAFHSSSALIFSALGRRMQSLRLPDLHPAILDLVSTALEANACSLFVCQDQGVRMAAARPGGDHHRAATAAGPLVDLALREARVVTLREFLLRTGGRVVPKEMPLMAGPLMASDRRVYGVVIVESMPITRFTASAVTRFDALLGWASAAVRNALRHQEIVRKHAVSLRGPFVPSPATGEPVWEEAPAGRPRL
ncbi:MAG: GAF domain-containing protein [Anaerolineales bacterium]